MALLLLKLDASTLLEAPFSEGASHLVRPLSEGLKGFRLAYRLLLKYLYMRKAIRAKIPINITSNTSAKSPGDLAGASY